MRGVERLSATVAMLRAWLSLQGRQSPGRVLGTMYRGEAHALSEGRIIPNLSAMFRFSGANRRSLRDFGGPAYGYNFFYVVNNRGVGENGLMGYEHVRVQRDKEGGQTVNWLCYRGPIFWWCRL